MTAPWQRCWLKSKDNPLIFVRDVLGATPPELIEVGFQSFKELSAQAVSGALRGDPSGYRSVPA